MREEEHIRALRRPLDRGLQAMLYLVHLESLFAGTYRCRALPRAGHSMAQARAHCIGNPLAASVVASGTWSDDRLCTVTRFTRPWRGTTLPLLPALWEYRSVAGSQCQKVLVRGMRG